MKWLNVETIRFNDRIAILTVSRADSINYHDLATNHLESLRGRSDSKCLLVSLGQLRKRLGLKHQNDEGELQSRTAGTARRGWAALG